MIHVLPDDKFCVFDTFRENNANSQSPKGMWYLKKFNLLIVVLNPFFDL